MSARSLTHHRGRRISSGRWRAIGLAALAALLATSTLLSGTSLYPVRTTLFHQGVNLEDGAVVTATSTTARIAGTHVTDTGTQAALHTAQAQLRWLEEGTVLSGQWEQLTTDALLDLHVLGSGSATLLPVAGWRAAWRYLWPRDSAAVAVALAATGHTADAIALLQFFQDVQREDGSFAARYTSDGAEVADGRAEQSDSAGWLLWAVARVNEYTDGAALSQLRSLVDRSTEYLLTITATGLPPASSDSWEMQETDLTLGTAATALMGLEAARELVPTAALEERATQLRDQIVAAFAPTFQRYAHPTTLTSWQRQGADANVALLLPPFQPTAVPGAAAAWEKSLYLLREPAGGISPGEGWRDDGVTWMPQTTLYAWVAAVNGREDLAQNLLAFIEGHTTELGSISEKVSKDGAPLSVAPLGWAAANTILAVVALEE